jgi:hypothetical protein
MTQELPGRDLLRHLVVIARVHDGNLDVKRVAALQHENEFQHEGHDENDERPAFAV